MWSWTSVRTAGGGGRPGRGCLGELPGSTPAGGAPERVARVCARNLGRTPGEVRFEGAYARGGAGVSGPKIGEREVLEAMLHRDADLIAYDH